MATLLKLRNNDRIGPGRTNGPLMPEHQEAAPHALYIPRHARSTPDNEVFVKPFATPGKKTLIMAGVWTNVCVMFPALEQLLPGSRFMP